MKNKADLEKSKLQSWVTVAPCFSVTLRVVSAGSSYIAMRNLTKSPFLIGPES